jgi:hypothetical protein
MARDTDRQEAVAGLSDDELARALTQWADARASSNARNNPANPSLALDNNALLREAAYRLRSARKE